MTDIDYAGYVLAIRDAAVEAGMRVDGSWEFAASTKRLTNRLAELQAEVERLTRERSAEWPVMYAVERAYDDGGLPVDLEIACAEYRALLESKGNDE